MKVEKLNNIDFLKIIFTFAIVLNHSLGSLHMWTQGRMAVEFFFIVSVFMLFYSNYNKDRSSIYFIKTKLIRFYPLIIFGSVCLIFYSQNITYEKLIAPLLFLPATGFYEFNFIATGSTWYLSVLFWISIFLFNIKKVKSDHTVNIIIGVLVFLFYISCIKYGWGKNEPLGEKGTFLYLLTQGMARGFAGMGLGYLFACFWTKNRHTYNNKSVFYSFVEIIFFILSILMMFNQSICPKNKIFLVMTYFFLIICFVFKKGYFSSFIEKYNYDKISKYMLSLFLTHQLVTDTWYRNLPTSSIVLSLETYQKILLFLIMSSILAFLAHHFIEVPGGKLMKKLLFTEPQNQQGGN